MLGRSLRAPPAPGVSIVVALLFVARCAFSLELGVDTRTVDRSSSSWKSFFKFSKRTTSQDKSARTATFYVISGGANKPSLSTPIVCPQANQHLLEDDSTKYCSAMLQECQCREEQLKSVKAEKCAAFVRDLSLVTKESGTCLAKIQLATEKKHHCLQQNEKAATVMRKEKVKDILRSATNKSSRGAGATTALILASASKNVDETDATEFKDVCDSVDYEQMCGKERHDALCLHNHCGRRITSLNSELKRIDNALELYGIISDSLVKRFHHPICPDE
ncbi:unnamed protein product [Amoebophrya sp. A120]|nr:unnamed protein product [Amoebophrya sp. A120]|eukprot:GSA120T00021861001.1